MMLHGIIQDIRYAIRGFRASPGFAVVAILSLALGIGANTAIFSLINAIMLKSLPVNHPEQLVQVTIGAEQYFSNPIWEQLRDHQDVFSGIFAYGRWSFNLAPSGEVRRVQGQFVSGQYFDALGVHAVLGRTLTRADDIRGCVGTAVLSHGLWQREYAGHGDILGKTILLENHSFEIIGVTQPEFTGVEVGVSADVFVPLCAEQVLDGDESLLNKTFLPGWLQVIGRLKPGFSPSQVNARLKTLAPEVFRASLPDNWREEDRNAYLKYTLYAQPAAKGLSVLRRQYSQSLVILMAIAGMVLLIACTNITNLLLARGAARERELATRVALGSSRTRLIRQLLTESLLLSSAGAVVGIVFAYSATRLLVRFLHVSLNQTPDSRVLMFTATIAMTTGLLFGMAPAWRCARIQPHLAMKATNRGVVGTSRFVLGKLLVALQVALSLVLVVGAVLLSASLWKLNSTDTGLDPDHVLVVTVDFQKGNDTAERRAAKFRETLEKLRALPGVHSASVSNITPLCGCRGTIAVVVDALPRSRVLFNKVADQYFEAIGTSIVAGRDFKFYDTPKSLRVAIINESMAKQYFGAANPLGHHLRVDEGARVGDPYEIVGVAKDAKYGTLREQMSPTLYLTRNQDTASGSTVYFELRTAGNSPEALIEPVKSAIGRDASLQFTLLAARITKSLSRERLLAALSGLFGILALMLAMMGLYGVMSYNITRRRNEIAIRVALGADRARLFRAVMGEVALLVGAGLLAGLVLAMITTRFVATLLYGLKPTDPMMLFIAAALLAGVGLLAGYLPARRASRLDPMLTLRHE